MIEILIADDHPVVREGMKSIIEKAPEMIVTGEANDGAEALVKVYNNHYDVVLLDISMPGRSGLEILEEIKAEIPNLPVLILSIYPEQEYAIRALKNGASGYLTKKSAVTELVTAIKTVSIGQKYISTSLGSILASYIETDSQKKPHENLSNREHQIFIMICQGKTLTQIAYELSLSVRTVSTYRTRIMEKMNMKNNAELMHYAFKNDLTD